MPKGLADHRSRPLQAYRRPLSGLHLHPLDPPHQPRRKSRPLLSRTSEMPLGHIYSSPYSEWPTTCPLRKRCKRRSPGPETRMRLYQAASMGAPGVARSKSLPLRQSSLRQSSLRQSSLRLRSGSTTGQASEYGFRDRRDPCVHCGWPCGRGCAESLLQVAPANG